MLKIRHFCKYISIKTRVIIVQIYSIKIRKFPAIDETIYTFNANKETSTVIAHRTLNIITIHPVHLQINTRFINIINNNNNNINSSAKQSVKIIISNSEHTCV